MASSDMPEIVGLSHRAFVMRDGAFVGELDRDALDHPAVQESVFRMATALDGPKPTSDTRLRRKHHDHPSRHSASRRSRPAAPIVASPITGEPVQLFSRAVDLAASRCATRWSSSCCW